MGILKCRCGAEAKGKTFEEADNLIDHSIALIKGNGCTGNPLNMTWNGKPVAKLSSLMEKKPSPPKKSPPKKPEPKEEPKKALPKKSPAKKKGGKSKKKKPKEDDSIPIEDQDENKPELEPQEEVGPEPEPEEFEDDESDVEPSSTNR